MSQAARRPGRPGLGDRVAVRLDPEVRAGLARWAEGRPDVDRRRGRPVEADAVRVIVEERLAAEGILRPGDATSASEC